MQNCYSDQAVFNDPVFQNLNAAEVKSMWEMFCKKGKDLEVHFSNVNSGEVHGTAKWIAHYTFSQTGKKVVNKIDAKFRFENGLIIYHEDDFNFYNWASQALGLPGILLGKTAYLKNKVRKSAMKNLDRFMKSTA